MTEATPKKRSAVTSRIIAARRALSERMIDVRVYVEIDEPETIRVTIGTRDEEKFTSRAAVAKHLETAVKWL